MAEIRLQNLAHSYDAKAPAPVYALEPMDMVWEDGGTYALLGPSGCGKSTMLNIISGLLTPSQGRVLFDGRDVTTLSTARRNIAQVFQVPVIYRSMTVAQNLAFPLVCRKVAAAEVRRRVGEIAELLGLSDLLTVPAVRLTADQKQLISLGRGLVRDDVSAILLDEPLTVIDPQMKFELRKTLKRINERYRLTMVLVTHDQNEAMTFARTVVVMNHGRVIQAGDPQTLFERPATDYVGTFIGSPAMNFLPAVRDGDRVRVPEAAIDLPRPPDLPATGALQIGIRPEHVGLAEPGGEALRGRIDRVRFEGAEQVVDLDVGGLTVRAKTDQRTLTPGTPIGVTLPPNRLCLYRDGALVG